MPTTPPRQNTIVRPGEIQGVGLHTGAEVRMRIHPAPVDTGIVFRRTDLPGSPDIPANLAHVVGTDLGTSIGVGEARLHTVEHLLSALVARDIDNALVEVNGVELPAADGSETRDVAHAPDAVDDGDQDEREQGAEPGGFRGRREAAVERDHHADQQDHERQHARQHLDLLAQREVFDVEHRRGGTVAGVRGDRIAVLYSNKDYSSEWGYHPDSKRFMAVDNTRFAVNLVVYALTR